MYTRILLKQLLILSIASVFFACGNDQDDKKVIAKSPQDVNKIAGEQLTELLSKKVNDSLLILDKDSLITYAFFNNHYSKEAQALFTDKGKWNAIGDSLYTIIKDARYYGLIPADYHFQKIDSLYKSAYNKEEETYDARAIAKIDLLLMDGYYKFGAHLNKGRFYPDSLLLEWKPSKLDSNWNNVLKWGIQSKNIRAALDSLEPKHEGYVFLKKEFKKYLIENEKLNWDSISFANTKDTTQFLEQLKVRLIGSGDYDSSGTDSDSIKMAKAIKSFQTKMNLDPDGKLGKLTKQALKLSKENTIRQMEMSLERWRWEQPLSSKKYFWVNIPAANLHIYEKDEDGKDTLVLFSNVVVGKPETQTPILNAKINYLLIYPYWTVPYSIAWKEILPAVQRDTNYLHKKNFDVINSKGEVVAIKSVNWKKLNKGNLPYKFRQRIGDDNSLGVVKFNFNNKYGVYLHDTNSKRYFKTFYRYQSHGCVRLDKYWETAKFLTRDDTLKLPYDTLATYFQTPFQRQINMKKLVPIYIRYYTTVADSTGLYRYIDIYRKDEKMAKLVYRGK
ncbi:MAG TPA: L,D-transpeptidase family protein [Bacteroidia bacterium]